MTTVIDLGSNTGRAVVIQPRPGGHLEVVEELRLPLQLAASIDDAGRLTDEACDRTMRALEDFLAISRAAGVEHVIAVGTSALRDAANGIELIERLRDELGIDVRVIDGEQEGHYAFLGAVHGLPVQDGVLIDIGGGSVELARFDERRVTGLWSFPLGTLRTTAAHLADDPPTSSQVDSLRAAVRDAVTAASIPTLRRSDRLVGTGGAIRNVAKVDRRNRRRLYPVPRLHGYEMGPGRVRKVGDLVRSRSASDRAALAGLNPSRAETIVAGVTVLETVMDVLKARRLVVSGQGLREGVVRGALGDALPPVDPTMALPEPRAVRRASMRAAAARFASVDPAAGQRRAWTALELTELCGAEIGESLQELIEYAATMIDAGASIDFYNRERVAADLVMTMDLAGFSHLMVAELAALLLLLEDPRFDVHRFTPLLSAEERNHLDAAAAALALAFEVHRRVPAAAAIGVRFEVTRKAITLEVATAIGRLPEQVSMRVEQHFGRKLQVRTAGRSEASSR